MAFQAQGKTQGFGPEKLVELCDYGAKVVVDEV